MESCVPHSCLAVAESPLKSALGPRCAKGGHGRLSLPVRLEGVEESEAQVETGGQGVPPAAGGCSHSVAASSNGHPRIASLHPL